ncbi:sensor histidine kinase [Patulibacter americanus]|uniref:sensor histidine kinase n=1 Tax=Patulibacter americanus TaxID=588672 RepID=UPI0003B791FE|nr:HAMP domain-containing sensor histidine kinase [Patulibacter americanus]
MTLRARLIATLFVITALGMLALAAVTYTSQRGALLDQVDARIATARAAAQIGLAEQNGLRATEWPGRRGGPADPGPGRGDDGPRGGNLPPGTYAELRAASGTTVGAVVRIPTSYYAAALAPPELPRTLRAGATFTTDAVGGGDLRYRVRTYPNRGGPGPGPGGPFGPGASGPSGSGAGAAGAPTTTATTGSPRAAARVALRRGVTVVAVPLTEVDDTLSRLMRTEAIVIGVALALLTAVAWAIVRVGLRPLDRMASTAGEIAAGRLDQRVADDSPRTEVGRLGQALNGMLGRLEGAFAEREASEGRLRQFLSDASHELRTPLASIRGYAELFRVGAVREPDDVARAMGRIEDEAARMGTLVEDLLVLARLDEAPEHARQPVDVALIAEDAAHDARATDPERPLRVDTDGEAIVLGDDGQLRQVLANLVRNALVHTPPGTEVAIASRLRGDVVELEVRDHGAGLPTDDPASLFGRFWRAEGGRARGRSGAGLGLAIVAGIVEAHGGDVRAADAPGGGASFVVTLPLAPGDDAPEGPRRA